MVNLWCTMVHNSEHTYLKCLGTKYFGNDGFLLSELNFEIKTHDFRFSLYHTVKHITALNYSES
jgi:hypothetical protein